MEPESINEKSELMKQIKIFSQRYVMWELLVKKIESKDFSNMPRVVEATKNRIDEYYKFKDIHLKEHKEILNQQKKNIIEYEMNLQRVQEVADDYKKFSELLARLLEILKCESEARNEKGTA